MKIQNIAISNINLVNNTAKITFEIIEATENVNISLKINDNDYQQIFTNKTNEILEYTVNLKKGVNNLSLKLTNENEEYISEPFQVILKEEPNITDINLDYSDSNGKFILSFTLNGDNNFKYNIYMSLDNGEYTQILSNQISGKKTIEKVSTMGNHTCILKVNDGYDEYTFDSFSFEITNHKPILTKILVTNINNNGTATINYSAKDIENPTLTHTLTIDDNDTIITPSQTNNFFTYNLSDLSVGIHNCKVKISDGIDITVSDVFTIEIFTNSTDKKEILRQAKARYDNSYNQLKNIIISVVSDKIFDYDIENDVINKAKDYYSEMYSNFNRIAQKSIDAIGTNKVNVTKQDLENQINDVDNAVDNLETTMNGVFKDGVLDESEKRVIEENLNMIAKEKVDVDEDYNTLYNNEDLINPSKSKLKTTYDAFIVAHNTLVTTINNIINKTGIIDNTDKTNVNTAFTNWRTALGNYRNASLEAIDSIAKKKADDSADVVDKKYAEIILDPDTGIQMQVGNLTNKVNNVTTELQEIDERIAKIEVDSDSITSTVSHLTNKVDNMAIGTRNYVLNSAFDNGTKGWGLASNCYIDKTKTLNNYPSCKSVQSGLTADNWRGCINYCLPTRYNLGIKTGETWTFSCWYYVEDKTTFDNNLALEIKGKPSGSTNEIGIGVVSVPKDNIIEGKWTRLVGTITTNTDFIDCCIRAYVVRNGTAWFTCFQLEKGNVTSDWNPAPEDDSGRLTIAESNITQLSNSITSMVTENDVHSIIQQTPSDVQIGFNGISNNVVINSNGLTVNKGYIACDTLTTPTGHEPVINLFQNKTYDVHGNLIKHVNCQIDARASNGGDYGGAIRLKYDANSYLMMNDSGVFFFIEGEQAFSFVSDGSTYGAISINESNIGYLEMGTSWIAYNNKGLAFDDHIHEIYSLTTHNHDGKYASSSHTHNYASSSHTHDYIQSSSSSNYKVSTYGGSTGGEVSLRAGSATVYLSNYSAFSLYPSSANIDLGLSNNRWRYIYSQNALNTSDKKYKENIIYIDELLNNETMTLSLDNNTQQETLFLDFIKNDFRPALYNYISESGEEQLADEQLGFIANDIIDTEVGQTFLYDYGTNGESEIMFSPIGYTTVIARALQEEIMVRENKISELESRITELENKLNQ